MKPITLNIGLARKGKSQLTIRQVYNALAAEDISVLQSACHHSNTEMTFVCRAILPAAPDTRHGASEGDMQAVYRAAQRLEQDAIAIWSEADQAGVLVGPNAAAWGTFNPSFFLTLNGRFLNVHPAQ